jgi:large subunit ribosomal protein L29
MKAEKLRGIDVADLQRQAQDTQEQLFRFRFQMGMGQMEGLKKYRNLKKDRARMLTVLEEKRASGETPGLTTAKPADNKNKSEKKRKK